MPQEGIPNNSAKKASENRRRRKKRLAQAGKINNPDLINKEPEIINSDKEDQAKRARDYFEAAEKQGDAWKKLSEISTGMEKPRVKESKPEKKKAESLTILDKEKKDEVTIDPSPAKTTSEPKVSASITKTPEATPGPQTPEEKKATAEINKLPQEKKEKLGIGINNIGFVIENTKSNWFANTFGWLSKKSKEGSTVARFTKGLSDSFKKDAEMSKNKILAVNEGNAGWKTKTSNFAYGIKNIWRPAYLMASYTGVPAVSWLKLVMGGAMAAARLTGVAKETRLANEEVLQKTRMGKKDMQMKGRNFQDEANNLDIQVDWRHQLTAEEQDDIEKAQEEALRIYEEAKKRVGPEGKVSASALQKAYVREIPKDLQERLKNTAIADGATKGILRKHLEWDVKRLDNSVKKIEQNDKLTTDQKELKKSELIQRWEKRLVDYDRVLTNTGTVDQWAMAFRYAEATSKNVLRGATLLSLSLSVEKVFKGFSDILSSHHDFPNVLSPNRPHIDQNLPKIDPDNLPSHEVIPGPGITDSDAAHIDVPTSGGGASLEDLSIVHKNEGIEHAFIRQIEHDPKSFGFEGNLTDAKAVHLFAQHEAHRAAGELGYVDGAGHEVRVAQADKVGYELNKDGGKYSVNEKTVLGETLETHKSGEAFESTPDKHEYSYTKGEHVSPDADKVVANSGEHTEVNSFAKHLKSTEEHQKEMFAHPHSLEEGRDKMFSKVEFGAHEAPPLQSRDITYSELRNKIGAQIDEAAKAPAHVPHGKVLRPMFRQQGEVPGTYRPYNVPRVNEYGMPIAALRPDFAANPYGLSAENLANVYQTHQQNVAHMFGDTDAWADYAHLKAKAIFENVDLKGDAEKGPLYSYLHKLQEVTGVKPYGVGWLNWRAETAEQYVARAMQRAAEMGRLDQLNLENPGNSLAA